MLFGRKTPPTGTPKAEGAPTAGPAVPEPVAAGPSAPLPPLSTPSPASSAMTPASASSPSPLPTHASAYRTPLSDKGPEMTATPPKPPIAPAAGASVPRRMVDIPGAPRSALQAGAQAVAQSVGGPAAAPAPLTASPSDVRRLTVGRDISLCGEIASCDVLVVEGTVEAKLRDGRNIEIADTGLFKGSVEIDEADIAGRFEGDITVRGRLRLRATGKITGTIRYGELEVEAGGQLVGQIEVYASAPAARPAAVEPAPAAEPVPAE